MDLTQRSRTSSFRAAAARVAAAATISALAVVALAPAGTGAASTPTTASVIATAKDSKLGTILAAGNTVYTLKPSKTECDAKCLKVWPPVLLPTGMSSATAGNGVDASKLGTVAAADGALQITYGGKPLYFFEKDKVAGQVKGNVTDKWGKWAAVVTVAAKGGGDKSAGSGGASF